jgi:hypothetical protein
MTTAAELITELDDNGVVFGADNGEIWITPRSALKRTEAVSAGGVYDR